MSNTKKEKLVIGAQVCADKDLGLVEGIPVISLHTCCGGDHLAFVGIPDNPPLHDREHIKIEIPAKLNRMEVVAYFDKVLERLMVDIEGYNRAQVQAFSDNDEDIEKLTQTITDTQNALDREMDSRINCFSESIL